MYNFHKDGTKPINPNTIFVFGSNLAGRHGAGAAKAAHDYYGAVYGVGEGLTGRSYALPTVDNNICMLPLVDITGAVARFKEFATNNPDMQFFMTRVGCVLAGYSNEIIAPMFKGCSNNVDFPQDWKEFLE